MTTTFTVDGITEGLNYRFQVSASNILGEGELSDIFVVFVSDMPEIMAPVVTSISGTKVLVDWQEPDFNHDPILEYEVQFVSADGTLVIFEEDCGGSDPSITHCEIEMHTVIAGTGLARGQLIRAQVRAINSYAYSEPRLYPDLR